MSKLDLETFETVVAYKSLTDSVYLSTIIDYVKPQYFKNKDIRAIFTIIQAFFQKRLTTPTYTEIKNYLINDSLKNSFKAVVSLFKDIENNFNQEELNENTERFLKENAVYHTMLGVVDDITNQSVDTAKILYKFEQACNVSLSIAKGIDLFQDIDALIENITLEQKYISSGWSWIDQRVGGGFLEAGRSLYIFTGETNIGKSIVLGNIAVNIANQGKTVVLITLEMPELIYAQRLSSNISKIPLSKLKTETPTLKVQLEEHVNSNPKAKILIKEFPPSTITPSALKGYLQQLQRSGIIFDAIVIDYVNLLNSPLGTTSYERIKIVTEQLRALSYTFNCPIISATQSNRSGYSVSDPGLETISESMGLAMTADVIMSIWQEDNDRELGIIRLGLIKNRFGPNKVNCQMRIDYSTLTINEDEHTNDTEACSSSANLLASLSE